MLSSNLTSAYPSRNPETPAPPPPSPALTAALTPLRAYRAAHPFPPRSQLPQTTPEQLQTRSLAWDQFLCQQADQHRTHSILAQEADQAWLRAQEVV